MALAPLTHMAQKRIYADGLDINHRLPGHGHGTKRANDSDAPFQMAQGDMFVAYRAREMFCRNLTQHTPRNDLISWFASHNFLGLANR